MWQRRASNRGESAARSLRNGGRRLNAEHLEDRRMMAGLVFDAAIHIAGNPGRVVTSSGAVDDAGNQYMAGYFYDGAIDFDLGGSHVGNVDVLTPSGAGQDAFVAKYDTNGEFLWARTFGSPDASNDQIWQIAADDFGNAYVAGEFNGSASFGSFTLHSAGSTDGFLAKLSSAGQFEWVQQAGGAGNDSSRQLSVNGQFGSVTWVTDISDASIVQLMQFNLSGNTLWTASIAGTANVVGIDSDSAGNLILAGSFRGTVDLDPGPGEHLVHSPGESSTLTSGYVVKLASGGGFQWGAAFDGEESVNPSSSFTTFDVAVGPGDAVAVVGKVTGAVDFDPGSGSHVLQVPAGHTGAFIVLDAAGNFVAANALIDNSADNPSSPANFPFKLTAAADAYFIAGMTTPTATFSPSPGISIPTSGSNDIFIVELALDGEVLSAATTKSSTADFPGDVFTDDAGAVYLAGYFGGTNIDLNPDPAVSTAISNVAGADGALIRLRPRPDTKFYVVNDATANRTYEYGAGGEAVENFTLNSGNSAPRGAASTAAGDKVWVIDANRKVFVYNTSGGLLGSWSAGTMASNAAPEDIATNGTDVWIVDAQSDKVFRYGGATGRLFGSQNAASSFNLNSANRDPKGIVTDGVHLWVVNDSSTDKVFKYTLSGSLVGSWTISAANSKPTGITLDPANVSDLWIVDSGTDRVYQYVGAASRTPGSQAAAASFALAAGNSNPQGIADPPPVGTLRQDNRRVSSSSVARPATVLSAVTYNFAPLVRSAHKASERLINGVLARQRVFETLALEPNNSMARRTAQHDSVACELEPPGISKCANDTRAPLNIVDIVFESAFASVT